jgi:hypothetical protein
MISKYFCQILLDTPQYDLEKGWLSNSISQKNYKHSSCERKWIKLNSDSFLWSEDTLNKFNTVDIKPYAIRLFKWTTNQLFPWHSDYGSKDSAYCVTNWVIEGGGLIEHNENIQLHNHPEGQPFKIKKCSADDEVQSSISGHKCLIDVYTPHRVNTVNSYQPRVTLSIVWKTLKNDELQFNDLRDRFNQIGLLDH